MSDLPKPAFSVCDVIRDCSSNYTSQERRERFKESIRGIDEYTLEFEEKVAAHCIDSLNDTIAGISISKEDMKKLYAEKLSKVGQPGRKYYDKLLASVPQSICPYCMVRPVESLDHYLIKSHYSYLSVSPTNLIPCCLSCNKEKGTVLFDRAEKAHIHPYFDNTNSDVWLAACVASCADGCSVRYQVVQPKNWDKLAFERMKNHFILFKLNTLYAVYAVDEIESSKQMFQNLRKVTGPEGLKSHLQESSKSFRSHRMNHWKAALYQALSESDWFINDYVATDS